MVDGSGVANSSWKSQLPRSVNVSMIPLTTTRTSASSSAILRGTNSGLRSRRYRVCSGGSTWSGISGCSWPIERASTSDEKISGWRSAQRTSSYLER